ncbi:MAG: hypothetical protein ACRC30_10930 [Clostridium sp.]
MGQLRIIVEVADEARRIQMEEGLGINASIRKACELYKHELKIMKLSDTDKSSR